MPAFDKGLSFLLRRAREGHLCVREAELEDPLPISDAIVKEGDRIYLHKNWVYETVILEQIRRLRRSRPTPLFERALFFEQLERQTKLLPEQKEAIRKAFEEPLFVLSGGPGTGKTYTAAAFLQLLTASLIPNEVLHLCIAAPTGKAVSHLQSVLLSQNPSLRIEAMTLHRLLKLQPGENHLFSKRRIDADLILVDEASMIDTPLLAHLLEAVGDGSRLVLMGDPDQLPPVENGSLFSDLSSLLGVALKRCMRTEESALTSLTEAVRSGNLEAPQLRSHQLPWSFDSTLPQKLCEQIQPICCWERPDPKQCLDHYASLRVLNALRQGPFGAKELNRAMQQQMRVQEGQWYALPILITANDSHAKLYNGMTGVLLCQKPNHSIAFFPDRPDPVSHLPPFEIAFCLSIHKSQGSEFEKIIALFPPGSEKFGKESLYTAITRAKKEFHWVGEEDVVRAMASRSSSRTSGLIERLK